jgi:uncharacterized protein (TIGR03437 family)
MAAGSLVRLRCSAVGKAEDLRGLLLIGGNAVPVLAASADTVSIQVPWEAKPGYDELSLLLPSVSPFESTQKVRITSYAPAFEPATGGQTGILPIAIFKGDWSGALVSAPLPGDVVHLYMTGLGPVKLPTQTGVPASLGELNPTVYQTTCRFLPDGTQLITLFSGLAPGLTGIYQVSLQAPPEMSTGPIKGISCSVGGFATVSLTVL